MSFPRRTDVARHLARKPRFVSKPHPDGSVGQVPNLDQQSPSEVHGLEQLSEVVRKPQTADKLVNR